MIGPIIAIAAAAAGYVLYKHHQAAVQLKIWAVNAGNVAPILIKGQAYLVTFMVDPAAFASAYQKDMGVPLQQSDWQLPASDYMRAHFSSTGEWSIPRIADASDTGTIQPTFVDQTASNNFLNGQPSQWQFVGVWQSALPTQTVVPAWAPTVVPYNLATLAAGVTGNTGMAKG